MNTLISFLSILQNFVLSLCKRHPHLYKKCQKYNFAKDFIRVTPCAGFIEDEIIKVNVALCYVGISPEIKTNVYLLLFHEIKNMIDIPILYKANNSNDYKWKHPITLKRKRSNDLCIKYNLPKNISINKVTVHIRIEYYNLIGEFMTAETKIGFLNQNECYRTITIQNTPKRITGEEVFYQMKL